LTPRAAGDTLRADNVKCRREIPRYVDEDQTRRERIDPRIVAAGWRVVPFAEGRPLSACERCAITEYPTENGPADYALCAGGRLLGIVEAKKLGTGPASVLTQAERYAKGLAEGAFDFRGFRVPFLYSTNGEVIWHHDIRHELELSRVIGGFHTPEALEEKLGRETGAELAALDELGFGSRLRDYQVEANLAIEKAIGARKRQMLVAMATGTGKTFTMVSEVYRLIKSGLARRVLFLVDRRALAAQAVRAFASYEPEPGLKFDRIYSLHRPLHREAESGHP
jgi:type I restriction enzyme R subunit